MKIDSTKWITISQAAKNSNERVDTVWRRIERLKKRMTGHGTLYLHVPEWNITLVANSKSTEIKKPG